MRTLIVSILIALAAVAPARGDELAAWLERHGLHELLTLHLEQALEDARDDETRRALVHRLAGLYAELLEATDDPEQRAALEQRSRRLVQRAPADEVMRLRLALLRNAYRSAEQIAERHRLRLAEPEEVEEAKATLTRTLPDITALETRLEDEAESLEHRRQRASGTGTVILAEQADAARTLHAQARFLRAWALYYQSWLHGRPDNAREAERIFGSLLDPDAPYLEPADVSRDRRGVEAFARAILGLALCRSLTAPLRAALDWVELLEDPQTHPPLRAQAPAWRMAILLEHDAWREARIVIEQSEQLGGSAPLPWLRLAAVHALEHVEADVEARRLADFSLARLAASGELEQIMDLARRFGADRLGRRGFAVRYVQAVIAYHEARQRHGAERPTEDPDLRAAYGEVIDKLAAAQAEPDADDYAEVLAASDELLAWCHYFRGSFLEASRIFQDTAERLAPDRAADALWMAIVALDRVVEAGGGEELAARLDALIDLFLERHPASEHAPKLVLRQAALAPPDPVQVERLLAIPASSALHEEARRRAADQLYRLFSAATSAEQRLDLAESYLEVALPALLAEADAGSVVAAVLRCRRVLEVALHDDVRRLVAAQQVLELLEGLAEGGRADLADVADEIAYRRVRFELLSGRLDAAEDAALALVAAAPDGAWSRMTERTLFRAGWERWQETRSGGGDDRRAVALVVEWGERVLAARLESGGSVEDADTLALATAVAEAHQRRWERSGDRASAERGLALYREHLLPARPRNGRFLRSTALLAEDLDAIELALDCWRTLLAARPEGSDAWFEARTHQIELLAGADPPRASAVIAQHMQFHPDGGPAPWGERIRAVERALRRAENEP